MTITGIYDALNDKAESFFEWAQAHPKFGLLFVAALLALWLTGLLFRWKWACQWQFGGKLWFFDDCKPETRRRIQIALVGVALAACGETGACWDSMGGIKQCRNLHFRAGRQD